MAFRTLTLHSKANASGETTLVGGKEILLTWNHSMVEGKAPRACLLRRKDLNRLYANLQNRESILDNATRLTESDQDGLAIDYWLTNDPDWEGAGLPNRTDNLWFKFEYEESSMTVCTVYQKFNAEQVAQLLEFLGDWVLPSISRHQPVFGL